MKILALAQVENDKNLLKQIKKQTVQPIEFSRYIDLEPEKGIKARRKRIADNHQQLNRLVEKSDCDFVWQLEQDVILEEDTLEKLIKDYEKLKHPLFGYVSGVQVGRHGIYAIGAWHIGIDEFTSLDHKLSGIQEVDATGFYCLLAPKHVWLQGQASWNDEPYGPDVVWGLSLKHKGYRIYADLDMPLGHEVKREKNGTMIKTGEIWPKNNSTCNVRFYKKNNQWEYKTS